MYVDVIFALYGYILFFFFFFFLYPSLLRSSMFEHDWTNAVLGVLYACVLYFCISTCSAQLIMFHMEKCSTNTLIIITTITLQYSIVCLKALLIRRFTPWT